MPGTRTQELAALKRAMRNTLADGLLSDDMDTMTFNDWNAINDALDEFVDIVYNWVHRKNE